MKHYWQANLLFAFFTGFEAVQKGRLDQSCLDLKSGSSLISGEHHG